MVNKEIIVVVALSERASANWLCIPLIWADTVKLNLAVIKTRHLIRCMRASSLLEPDRATTAELSDRKRTDCPTHRSPHIAAAITTGLLGSFPSPIYGNHPLRGAIGVETIVLLRTLRNPMCLRRLKQWRIQEKLKGGSKLTSAQRK